MTANAAAVRRLVDRIREERGPFFLARLALRVSFRLEETDFADPGAAHDEIVAACRAIGHDPLAQR
jgi:hypothetical protein